MTTVDTSFAVHSGTRSRGMSNDGSPFHLEPVPPSAKARSKAHRPSTADSPARPAMHRAQSSVEALISTYGPSPRISACAASNMLTRTGRSLTSDLPPSVWRDPTASHRNSSALASTSTTSLSPPTHSTPTTYNARSSSMRPELYLTPATGPAPRSYTEPARIEEMQISLAAASRTPSPRSRSGTTPPRPRTSPDPTNTPRFGSSVDSPGMPSKTIGRHLAGSVSLVSLDEVTRAPSREERSGGLRELARKASNKLLRRKDRNSISGPIKAADMTVPPVPSLPSSSDLYALSQTPNRSRPDPNLPLFDYPQFPTSTSSVSKTRKKPALTASPDLSSSSSSLSIGAAPVRSRSRSNSASGVKPIRTELPPVPPRSPDLLSTPMCYPLRKDSLASSSSGTAPRSTVTTPSDTSEKPAIIKWPSALRSFGFIDRSFFDDPYARDSEDAPSAPSRPPLSDKRSSTSTTLRVTRRGPSGDSEVLMDDDAGEASSRDWANEREKVKDEARSKAFDELLSRSDQTGVIKLSLTPSYAIRH